MEAQVTVESGGQMVDNNSTLGSFGYTGNPNCWLWLQGGGQMTISGSMQFFAPMTNAGTFSISGGFDIANNNTTGAEGGLVNLAGGVINLLSGAAIQASYGDEYLVNQGTINATNGGGTINLSNLTNSGTVATLGTTGTLLVEKFNGLGSLTGNFNAAAGTTIQFGATANPGTSPGAGLTLGGSGQYQFVSGLLTLTNNPIPNLAMTGGMVALGPAFQGGAITNLTLNGITLTNTLP